MHLIVHTTLASTILYVIGFIIAWIITSIPVWLASKAVSKHSSFPRAMLATLGGLIIFAIIFGIFYIIGAAIRFPLLTALGLLFGFIGILGVFKAIFETGWGGAFLIALLAFVITIIIGIILAFLGIIIIHFL